MIEKVANVSYRERGHSTTATFAIQDFRPNTRGGVDLFLYAENAADGQQDKVTLNDKAVAAIVALADYLKCGPLLVQPPRNTQVELQESNT